MTVALCMIVKNEAAVIRRCLDSVRPFIDRWSICDTGSTDGTQDIIREHLRDLPGQLHERPWIDQQHNRNESIELARDRAEHLLLIDADETLRAEGASVMPALTADGYELTVRSDQHDFEWARCCIISTAIAWSWVGRRHPWLSGPGAGAIQQLPGFYVVTYSDGATWRDPNKYHKHAQEMAEDVERDPDNPRLRYYLAQSYRDSGQAAKAIEHYLTRADMGGWAEERWSAAYEAAKLIDACGLPQGVVMRAYIGAHTMRPTRAEPLYRLARYLRLQGDARAALYFARQAAEIPRPPDRLFVEVSVYRWRALDEVRQCAIETGDQQLERQCNDALSTRLPAQEPTHELQSSRVVQEPAPVE